MTLKIKWLDSGREPQCPPDPAYPNGVVADLRYGENVKACEADLPYPAKRCGTYIVTCDVCGITAAITTAGRPDDPNHVIMRCGG
ncbi:MAG: hypothetical protein J2P55_11075 [Rhizobiales bacterium]|nr:hypothetical protein [Hyphomicrobiales bacterium]